MPDSRVSVPTVTRRSASQPRQVLRSWPPHANAIALDLALPAVKRRMVDAHHAADGPGAALG